MNNYSKKNRREVRNCIRLTTVGDISFMGRNADSPSPDIFASVKSLFSDSPFVVANLESPLLKSEGPPAAGKCTLRGHPDWADIMAAAGINLVSLANNHMMDYGKAGLLSTMQALDRAGIKYVGAGLSQDDANAPIIADSDAGRFAFLSRTSVEVSSRSYSSATQPGVAFMGESETINNIRRCREKAEFVVVLIHWGLEDYHYPTPKQRRLAKKFISAGAQIILGHHPHVLQGEEHVGDSLVSYSGGNFLFDEFPWSIRLADGIRREFCTSLTHSNRQGMLLQVSIEENGTIRSKPSFTLLLKDGSIAINNIQERQQQYSKLCQRLNIPLYDAFWKIYSVKREWDLRIKRKVSLGRFVRNFYKIRPRHIKDLIKSLSKSSKITTGKSTNPYE